MKKLDELYKKIQENNIFLFDFDVPNSNAATICIDNRYSIFADYDNFKTLYDEFKVVAHEYGHCASGATHKLLSDFDIIERHEYRANRTSIIELLPYSEIERSYKNGCQEVWQIADFLDLPAEFVDMALEHYRHIGLI